MAVPGSLKHMLKTLSWGGCFRGQSGLWSWSCQQKTAQQLSIVTVKPSVLKGKKLGLDLPHPSWHVLLAGVPGTCTLQGKPHHITTKALNHLAS